MLQPPEIIPIIVPRRSKDNILLLLQLMDERTNPKVRGTLRKW
jgi:hypothetical protein